MICKDVAHRAGVRIETSKLINQKSAMLSGLVYNLCKSK